MRVWFLALLFFHYFFLSIRNVIFNILTDLDAIEKLSKAADLDCGSQYLILATRTHTHTHAKAKNSNSRWARACVRVCYVSVCACADKWFVLIRFVAAFVASKRKKSTARAQCIRIFCVNLFIYIYWISEKRTDEIRFCKLILWIN